jgi:two-component system NarL family sensor kinase
MKPANDPAADLDDMLELKHLADALLHRREVERLRLAAQLGSRIASPVVIAKFMIEDAMRCLDGDERENGLELLEGARGGLRRVLNEVQRVSTELRPSMLDDLGLLPTIEWYCRSYERSHRLLHVERRLPIDEAELPDELKLPIFRFIEEALANVAKHANATRVQVSLSRIEDGLRLSVQDDGDGFDPAWLEQRGQGSRKIGLASVRQRIEASGGQLALEALPAGGARVTATWRGACALRRRPPARHAVSP